MAYCKYIDERGCCMAQKNAPRCDGVNSCPHEGKFLIYKIKLSNRTINGTLTELADNETNLWTLVDIFHVLKQRANELQASFDAETIHNFLDKRGFYDDAKRKLAELIEQYED